MGKEQSETGKKYIQQVQELSQLKEAEGEVGWLGSLVLNCFRLIDPPMSLMSWSPQKEMASAEEKANGHFHKTHIAEKRND